MDGSDAGRKTHQFNFQLFRFFRLLNNGWALCTQRAGRVQTKSSRSILRNPVALSCFLGERCSLMFHSVCTQTATYQREQNVYYFYKKAFTSDKQTWHTGRVLNSLIQWDKKQERHGDSSMFVSKMEGEAFQKHWGSLLRQTITAGGGSECKMLQHSSSCVR